MWTYRNTCEVCVCGSTGTNIKCNMYNEPLCKRESVLHSANVRQSVRMWIYRNTCEVCACGSTGTNMKCYARACMMNRYIRAKMCSISRLCGGCIATCSRCLLRAHRCKTLHHTVTHRDTLQHTATHGRLHRGEVALFVESAQVQQKCKTL